MSEGFPRATKSSETGKAGVRLVEAIITEKFNWNFVITNEQDDCGVDATVEVVTEKQRITGQKISLQIKSGNSYFKKTENGFVFNGDQKHINYYLNSQVPVILIICDIENKECYWESISENTIEATRTSWKLIIPIENKLNLSNKEKNIRLITKVKKLYSGLED